MLSVVFKWKMVDDSLFVSNHIYQMYNEWLQKQNVMLSPQSLTALETTYGTGIRSFKQLTNLVPGSNFSIAINDATSE